MSAAELIAEGGYDAATAAEIGRRAGYSRSIMRARFGSKEQLIDAVIRSAYEGPLTVPLPESATGMERVLARIDALGRLVDESPALLRMLYAVEFQAAGKGSGMTDRAASWVGQLRSDTFEALREGSATAASGAIWTPRPPLTPSPSKASAPRSCGPSTRPRTTADASTSGALAPSRR